MEISEHIKTKTIKLLVDLDDNPDQPVLVPIHILTIGRQTWAIIAVDRGAGMSFANGVAKRNPKDPDDPALAEKLAVKRACEHFPYGPPYICLGRLFGQGKKIYRAYRRYLRDC